MCRVTWVDPSFGGMSAPNITPTIITETKKHSPNTGARANNTLHK